MIGTIRKHSKVLWAIIITVVIVTFVFWGSNTSNKGGDAREYYLGSINGEVIQLEEYRSAMREVYLLFYFSYGEWPGDNAKRAGFDVQRETYFRLLMLQKLKREKIHVSDATVAKYAADLLRAMNRGQPASVAAFEQNALRPQGLSASDLERYLRHQIGIQQLMAVNGLSGRLVTPAEARTLYEREHEEIATEAVFFSATNYLSGITVSPELVNQFFTNRMAEYRLPERVKVSYVAFDFSNRLAQAEAELVKTNLNELIDSFYQQIGTNYYKEAKTPEEIRAKLREDLIRREAERIARREANDFAHQADALPAHSLAAFEKLAADHQLTVKTTEPFDREDGPKSMVVGTEFLKESFLRTPDEPFYGPLAGQDAAYVIALNARLPSEIPPLETIRDRVTADFRHVQAVLKARELGQAFEQNLTNGLAAGKKFSGICAEAGVKPIIIPALSLSTRLLPAVEEHVNLNQYKSAAFTTQVGHASAFTLSSDGGFVVFVREKLPIELTKLTEQLPAFINQLRMRRMSEAYQDWFRREAERSLRDTPVFRPQQPQMQPAGTTAAQK